MARAAALVLDADCRAGLATARSLGRQGVRVVVAGRERERAAPGLATRHATASVLLPDPETDARGYADGVVESARRHGVEAALCSTDWSLAALHVRREELAHAGVSPALATREALEVAVAKRRTLELAVELSIRVPRSLPVRAAQEVEEAAVEVGLPAVLKPDASWREAGGGGERVGPVYLETREQALVAARALVRPGAGALLQELVPGARETVKLFLCEGEVRACLVMACDRTWPLLGGSSTMRRTIEPPSDVVDAATRLVRAIGLDGYAEVEFRRDAAGRATLMEVNPRLSQSLALALRAGVDFPRMQLDWARGARVETVSRYPIGVRVGWLGGDLRVLAGALTGRGAPRPPRASTLGAIARDYLLRGAAIEGLDAHDPRPSLQAAVYGVSLARRRVGRAPAAARGPTQPGEGGPS